MQHSESNSTLKKANIRIAIMMGVIAVISIFIPFAVLVK